MRTTLNLVGATMLVSALGVSSPASAQTAGLSAGDVVTKLNSDQRSSFVAGAVDMASHMFAVNGDLEKAKCAIDWFSEGENPWPEIHAFFEAHSDRDAVAVLHVLINRKCGD